MKTRDLIGIIAADGATRPLTMTVASAMGATAAIGLAAALFFATIGVRPDFAQALQTVRFPFKLAAVASLAAPALVVVLGMARPGVRLGRWAWSLAIFPAVLLLGVAGEMTAVPAREWLARLVGSNAGYCMTVIPLLALAPLAAILLALRHGAPTRPRLAGAMAGIAAGAIAAFFYGTECFDDSPLFLATWYPLAIFIVTAVGALAGPRILRW